MCASSSNRCVGQCADLLHIGASGLAEGGDGVDRGDALRQHSIGGQLGQLCAPQVGAQDALLRDPVFVHALQHLDCVLPALCLLASNQHLQRQLLCDGLTLAFSCILPLDDACFGPSLGANAQTRSSDPAGLPAARSLPPSSTCSTRPCMTCL